MKNLRTSLACLALVASAAACSDANPLTAPGAPRYDGVGVNGSGGRADSLFVGAAEAGGGFKGSGNSVSTVGGGPWIGSGNRADTTTVTTADDGGQHGSGDRGGQHGNGA